MYLFFLRHHIQDPASSENVSSLTLLTSFGTRVQDLILSDVTLVPSELTLLRAVT